MKKVILTFTAIFLSTILYSQDMNFKYYSSIADGDFKSNYSGYAVAVFIKKSDLPTVQENMNSRGRSFDKLTINNLWLCRKALGEWALQDDEIYAIFLANALNSKELIVLLATITDGGTSFNWQGKIISTPETQ